ncbi:DUF397 domain-containing protein [Actinomadura rudentiformis]|uniref:DUF397 domain-containing protein n=1 Tax=Actinomadura rudentiformis TaxID=359158 RepID=A0A6H9YX31_9ACTN|nr:DUF397 domain-containing protein [Actinomadura rudentiformis]KAB2351787.1 DUF397 domain-containing protein [Actinomadura rudentiformis]
MTSAENDPISWRKGSRCAANGTCVEIAGAYAPGTIAARDAKHGEASPVLLFSPGEWRTFTDRIKSGELDLSR